MTTGALGKIEMQQTEGKKKISMDTYSSPKAARATRPQGG
jgi:hypothetical protein